MVWHFMCWRCYVFLPWLSLNLSQTYTYPINCLLFAIYLLISLNPVIYHFYHAPHSITISITYYKINGFVVVGGVNTYMLHHDNYGSNPCNKSSWSTKTTYSKQLPCQIICHDQVMSVFWTELSHEQGSVSRCKAIITFFTFCTYLCYNTNDYGMGNKSWRSMK